MFNIFSFEQFRASPLSQGFFVLLFAIIVCVGARGLAAANIVVVTPYFYWMVCTALVLVFIIFNTTFGARSGDILSYVKFSFYSFFALLLSTNYLAKFTSGLAIRDTQGFAWLYVVLVVSYLAFFSITLIMKQLWKFFEDENDRNIQKTPDER